MSAASTKDKSSGGFFGGLSDQARRELIITLVVVVLLFALEVILDLWEIMDTFFNSLGYEIDVVVPFFITLAVGLGVYTFRRLRELAGLNTARERATAAARVVEEESDRVRKQAEEEAERSRREAEQAREEAREAERMSAALIGSDTNIIFKVDSSGTVIEANDGAASTIGISEERLKGTNAYSYFQYPARAEDGMQRAIESGSASDDPSMEIRRWDGETLAVSYRAYSYKGANGEPVGVIMGRPR